jgi:nicotinamidase-related amidase
MELTFRARQPIPGSAEVERTYRAATWDPARTAAVICDMWDVHWCAGASARVAEMAPRLNETVRELRRRGALIIHAPSETLDFYANHPGRKLAQDAPRVETAIPLEGWVHLIPEREGRLPIDDSDGGCDCQPQCRQGQPWRRQIATVEIMVGDAITDSAAAFYLMRQRGLSNVLIMGVHVNMCVLGRPFGIRQLARQGMAVALVRDLTDAMYNSRMPPFVDHFAGTELVIEHIERHWCPTITSDQIIGGQPFRFHS